MFISVISFALDRFYTDLLDQDSKYGGIFYYEFLTLKAKNFLLFQPEVVQVTGVADGS